MMKKVVFFDLETQWLFDDIARMRNVPRSEVNPSELKLSVAGLAINEGDVKFFGEDDISKMVNILVDADLIIGHNLLGFDWYVLEPFLGRDLIEKLREKTFDTLKDLSDIVGFKSGLSLDRLAKLNLNKSKTLNSILIPGMWREGKCEEVKSHLKNDIDMIRELFNYGCDKGCIKIDYDKMIDVSWGKIKGEDIIRA